MLRTWPLFRRLPTKLAVALLVSSIPFAQASETRNALVGSPKVTGFSERSTATPEASEVLHINFFLKSAHRSDIPAFRASQMDPKSPNFHKGISPDEFGKRFGAADAEIKSVVDFAKANGFTITHVWENRLFIAADVPVAKAEAAFQVKIKAYQRPANLVALGEPDTFFSPDRTPTAPLAVADKIEAVFGLDNYTQMHPQVRFKKWEKGLGIKSASRGTPFPIRPASPVAENPNSLSGSQSKRELIPSPIARTAPSGKSIPKPDFSFPMSPSDISHFYGLDNFHTSGVNGEGQNIAIISPTKYNYQDNIDFANQFGLTGWSMNLMRWVDIDGGGTSLGEQVEACLDTEVIMGQAPHAHIYVFQFPNNFSSYIDTYNAISSPQYNFIQTVTQSYGFNEKPGDDSVIEGIDAALSVIASQGISFYNSSGDGGAGPGAFSTSPDATSVGGTNFLSSNADGAWISEQGWSGSGGGNSLSVGIPNWQTGPGVNNSYSNGHRQVPDVSAAGGPNPGYYVRCKGVGMLVFGTSASCPLWAVGNLLLDQQAGSYYGYTQWHSGSLNPELYWIGANLNSYRSTYNGAFVFRDATVGNNGFPATDGWDYVTGWGSANFWKLWADYVVYWGYAGTPYDGRYGSINISGGNAPGSYDDRTIYKISAPVGCNGPSDIPASTLNVQIDGVDNYFTQGPLPLGTLWFNTNLLSRTFSAGTHTITQYLTVTTPNYIRTTILSSKTISVLPAIKGFTLSPNPVTGGTAVSGVITLTSPAPAEGGLVTLKNTNVAASVPSSILVPGGQSTGTVLIPTSVFPASKVGNVSATYNGASVSVPLTVNPLIPTSITLTPDVVAGGNRVIGKVTLNGAAPVGGALVTLSTKNLAASVPASVLVPAGGVDATFTITTSSVSVSTKGYVAANYNGKEVSSPLVVDVATPKSVTFSKHFVIAGSTAIGLVTLTGPAPTGGLVVTLASSSASAHVPEAMTIPAGAVGSTFKVRASDVNVVTTVTVTATANGVSAHGNLKVRPNKISAFTISPASVKGGTSSIGTVTLAGMAAVDVTVTFTSTGGTTIPAPVSITIPAGSSSGSVTIPTRATFAGPVIATITASAYHSAASATLKATP